MKLSDKKWWMINFLPAVIFFSCDNIVTPNVAPPVSKEVLDTIQSPSSPIVSTPAFFENAFIKGSTQEVNKKTLYYYGINIGKIKITSGKIIACDPLHIDEYGIPFTQVFPTGEFPVQLSIAKLNGQESIAFARINFSNAPVAKWEFALLPGQKPLPVGGEEIHGYGVDAGVGIFIDQDARKALPISSIDNTEGGVYNEMAKHYHDKWKYTIYKFGSHNMAAFSTGFGDGRFATYVGLDASGKPCRLLTDFELFDWRQKK